MPPLPLLPPVLDDPDTGPFFRAAGEGRLVVRVCDDCDQSLHLPRVRCFACGSFDTSWHEVAGRGRIYTWTVVEHQVHPTFPTPFTAILVELDDRPDVRLADHLAGRPEIGAGTPVEVRFDRLDDDHALPGWQLLDDTDGDRSSGTPATRSIP